MPCLDDNDVVEFLEGLLSEDDLVRVDEHVDSCAACRAVVANVAARAAGSAYLSCDAQLECDDGLRAVPEMPGRYELREALGHGAQGWVFTAFDRCMKRDVALKCMVQSPDDDLQQRASNDPHARDANQERFLREAQVAAQLNHPTNVHVHEVGRRADGSLYYTMPVVRGPTLGQALAEASTLTARLALLRHFVDLCNGVAYAHSRGVIHRDIKPGNVMLGEFGETFLLDWGLAAWRNEQVPPANVAVDDSERVSGHTATGTLLGTPGYMSPEQAQGITADIGVRSDIWSLGAVLYHMLTGQPPHHDKDDGELVRRTRDEEVVPVRMLCAEVSAELAAVAEKALQRDPSRRYSDARELASEIGAYMAGGRVVAYPYSTWETIRRLVLRHKAAAVAVLSVFAVMLAAGVLLMTSYARERWARQQESAAREKEHRATQLAQLHLAEAYTMKAQRCLEDKDMLSARVYAAAALVRNPYSAGASGADLNFAAQEPGSPFLAAEATAILLRADVRYVSRLAHVLEAGTPLAEVKVSPSGNTVVAASTKTGIRLWDLQSLRMIVPERADEERYAFLAISPDGSRLAVASERRLRVRDARDGAILREFPLVEQKASPVAFSLRGKLLVSGGRDHWLRGWDVDSGRALFDWDLGSLVRRVAASPVEAIVAAGMQNGDIWICDVGLEKKPTRLGGHDQAVHAVAFSPDGQWLATGGQDRRVLLWDLRAATLHSELGMHLDAVNALAFSPDGRWVVSTGRDGVARGWYAVEGTSAFILTAPEHTMEGVAFTPDGRRLVTCGFDNTVRIWDLLPATPGQMSIAGHQVQALSLAFSSDSTTLVSGGTDGVVRIWDASTGALRSAFPGSQRAIARVALTPDGRRVVSGGLERTLRVGNASSGATEASVTGAGRIWALALSPDGTQVVFAPGQQDIRLAKIEGLSTIRVWPGHQGHIYAAAWSPDGTLIASGGEDGVVRIWDAVGGAMLAEHELHGNWITGLAFSPDGRWLASSGWDGSAVIWDWETKRLIRQLREHGQWVNEVAFSRDGRMLATAGDDGRVIVWSTVDWAPKLVIRTRGQAAALALAFAPDGKALAVGSGEAIDLVPLRFELLTRSSEELLREAEHDAGVTLNGMRLRATGGS